MTRPDVTIEVGFGATWRTEDASITWTDITQWWLARPSLQVSRGSTAAFGKPDVGSISITLDNRDRRFDPEHAASPYNGDLEPGVPFRVTSHDPLLSNSGEVLLSNSGEVLLASSSRPIGRGYVAAWPQQYDRKRFLIVPLKAHDGFSRLSRLRLPESVYDYEVMQDSPKAYWKLTDPDGSTVARDSSGNGYDGRYRNDPERTSVTEGLVIGEVARRFEQDLRQAVDIEDDAVRIEPHPSIAPFSMEGWFRTSSVPASGEYDTIYNQSNDVQSANLRFVIKDGGELYGLWQTSPASFDSEESTESVVDGAAHHGVFVLDTGTGQRLELDGETLASASDSLGGNFASAVTIGGHPNPNNSRDYWQGELSHIAIYESALSPARVQAHYDAGSAPWNGDTTDERITRVLDIIDWPSDLRDLEVGKSLLGPAHLQSAKALDYLRRIADSEDGKLFFAADGKLRFLDRHWPWTATEATTSQVTVTGVPGEDDDAKWQNIFRSEDDELIVNSATVSTVHGEETIEDDASIAKYGEANATINTVLTSTAVARGLAQWVVANRAEPQVRLPSVRIPLHAMSAELQDDILGLELYHRVTVREKHHDVGAVVAVDCAVAGIDHEVDQAEWWVELFLEPAPNNNITLFTLGTSTLGGSHVLAH